jgi:zinc transport system ATP-binding protein
VAVLGRNGSGKTTWLKTLLGLLRPVSGRVKASGRFGYVPQVAALDEIVPVKAGEVVLWGRLGGWAFLRPFASRADRIARDEALSAAHAADLADRSYRDLSEGQKQRVLFARLLVMRADVAVLDEPTASMDAMAEREALTRLAELARAGSMAVLVVAHDLVVAREFADRVVFVDRDDQAVVAGDVDTVFADPLFRRHYGEVKRGLRD